MTHADRPWAEAHELLHRHPGNPIITAAQLPYPANTVFNPGAGRVGGKTVLLMRVEDYRGISHLAVARSTDGATGWVFDEEPLLAPEPDNRPEEVWGCEDPRLTWLPDLGEWAIAYTSYSRLGPLVSLAMTADFTQVRRLGPVMPPEDKDAALFPRRFGDRWALIHRPSPLRGGAHIWISFSPDLRHWGDHALLLEAREGGWWDADKIGLGPPPLETAEGWLICYHGVHATASGSIYRIGLALLDLDDPRIVLRRTDEWIMGPTAPYERSGDVNKVVFPTGWVLDDATGTLALYYGAGDSVVAMATAQLDDLLDHMRSAAKPQQRRSTDHHGF
jgi:beta-1,4-mannooligosaccharide/beta-1,4-mannosyl-N-acetylglucosamine phosphorylase